MSVCANLVNQPINYNLITVDCTGTGRPDKDPFVGGEQEPWVNHGGLLSEFRVSYTLA